MKKIAIAVLIMFSMGLVMPGALAAKGDRHDKISKRTVKRNPNYRKGRDVRYFKVLIREDGEVKVKLTLPIALVDFILDHTSDMRIDLDYCRFDMKRLWRHIKKLGPKSLIEVGDRREMVRVWLE
jgi:hypothetical protein